MDDPVEALIADLIEYLAEAPRPYAEAQAAWRTSCPRLPVWEEAAARGFVARDALAGGAPALRATQAGLAFLARARQRPESPSIQGA